MKRKLGGLLFALGLGLPRLVLAVASCTTSASGVAFGSYAPLTGAARDSVGTVQVSCSLLGLLSLLVSYDVKLSTGGSASYATRQMASGTHHLGYNLYLNSAHTQVWGDGSAGTQFLNDGYLLGLGTTNRTYSIYGHIPGGQNAAVGSYADTITVTVTY